jgi:hypothetical protein
MSRRALVNFCALAVAVVVLAGLYALFGAGSEPAPPPAFQVMVIGPGNFLAEQAAEATAAGGRVPPNQIDFTAEVVTFKVEDLVRRAGVDAKTLDNALVLRSRDGAHITASGGDALSEANMSVIVIPNDILKMFDDERSAFQLIRIRISGLQ